MEKALSLSDNHRRIYFYLDKFPVLMNDLSYIFDIVQCGRSLNVRVIAGIQNIPQLYAAYGKDKGNALLSGFVTTLIMNPNDAETLHILSERSGKELVHVQSMGLARNSYHTETMHMNIIPEDEISMLDTGETIVSIKGKRPFWIKLE